MRTFLFKTTNNIWFSFQTENLEHIHLYKDIDVIVEVMDMFVGKMINAIQPKSSDDINSLYEEAENILGSFVYDFFETSFIPDDARPIETLLTEFPV